MIKPDQVFSEFQDKIKMLPDKKNRVREIAEFSVVYGDCYNVKIISLLENAIDMAREIGDKEGEVLCYCNLAFTNRVTGLNAPTKYDVSFDELIKRVEDVRSDPDAYTMGLNMLSYFH